MIARMLFVLALALGSCRASEADRSQATSTDVAAARVVEPATSGSTAHAGSTARAPGSGTPGTTSHASALPRFVSGDAPVYPELSRRHGEQGTVELRFAVRNDGSVESVQLAAPSGFPRLDEAALAAARAWRFAPRTGAPGVEVFGHRVIFQLYDRR